MTLKQKKTRRTAIIRELSRMSTNGWYGSTSDDWRPLEDELNRLEAEIIEAKKAHNAKKIVAMMKRVCRRPVWNG